jgi:hypothetical protein
MATEANAIIMIVGDFNAVPESLTYNHLVKAGYTSTYKAVHGKEPEFTFPTGL